MDALKFLERILPGQGTYFVGLLSNGKMHQRPFVSLPKMAAFVEEQSTKPGVDVYHACASFKDATTRKQDNADRAQAFWIDLDCGVDKHDQGKGYLSKKDAHKALVGYCNTLGLPRPLLVDSGNGLHAYFLLTKPIVRGTWEPIAEMFKQSLAEHGVIADRSRTADMASILRPVGSTNRKGGGERAVTLKCDGVPIDPRDFMRLVRGSVSALPPAVIAKPTNDLGEIPAYMRNDGPDEDQGYPARHRDANQVADKCQQVGRVRATLGAGPYEVWRGTIGIIKHCDLTPRETAGAWTAQRAASGSTQTDWELKYDTWNSPPTKCSHFEQHNPQGCDGCPHRGKITSPIQLGDAMPPAAVLHAVNQVGQVVQEVWPKGFAFDATTGTMVRYLESGDDANSVVVRPFASNQFKCVSHLVNSLGQSEVVIRAHHGKSVRYFNLDVGLINAGGSQLSLTMGQYGVLLTSAKDAGTHMHTFLKDDLALLRKRAEEVSTHAYFGWNDDLTTFLIGDRLYKLNGAHDKVIVGGAATTIQHAFPEPKGTAAGYAAAINAIYNRPNMEVMQYALCSSFGSILAPFTGTEYKGLAVALTGGRSGRGKTTVARVGLSAWGDPEALSMTGWTGATVLSRYQMQGALKNLPMLHDELTTMPQEQISDFIYRLSQGQDKIRLNTKGEPLPRNYWSLSPYLTANIDLHEILASANPGAEAEAVRFIELRVDDYAIPDIDLTEMGQHIHDVARNQGAAGHEFLKYILPRLSDVRETLAKYQVAMNQLMPDPKYRFYRYHAACTLTAADLMVRCGLCAFNVMELIRFAGELMGQAVTVVTANHVLRPHDAMQKMLSDIGPLTIVTHHMRGPNDVPEEVRGLGRDKPIARNIVGPRDMKNPNGGKMFINCRAFTTWCVANRVNKKGLLAHLDSLGALISDDFRIDLTKGTNLSGGRERCVALDMVALGMDMSPSLKLVVDNGGADEAAKG